MISTILISSDLISLSIINVVRITQHCCEWPVICRLNMSSSSPDSSIQRARKRRLVDTTGALPHSSSYIGSSDSASVSRIAMSNADIGTGIEILPISASAKFIRLYNYTDKVILHLFRYHIKRFDVPQYYP